VLFFLSRLNKQNRDHLARYKDELLIEYATYESNSQLFVQKYPLYLPDKEELRKILSDTLPGE